MKQFVIYRHPQKGHQAVKVGFCYPALFAGPFWLLARDMVAKCLAFIGLFFLLPVVIIISLTVVLLVVVIIFSADNEDAKSMGRAFAPFFAPLGTLVIQAYIPGWLLYLGATGNDIRRRHLLSEGFVEVGRVAEDSEEFAVELYLRNESKQSGESETNKAAEE